MFHIIILLRKFQKLPEGRISLILLIFLIVISVIISYLKGFITPHSIYVSGYNRTDGTSISSYDRRPPGSLIHDQRYENLIGFFAFIWIINFILLLIKGVATLTISKYELLNEERYKIIATTLRGGNIGLPRKNSRLPYLQTKSYYDSELRDIKELYTDNIKKKFNKLFFTNPTEDDLNKIFNHIFK